MDTEKFKKYSTYACWIVMVTETKLEQKKTITNIKVDKQNRMPDIHGTVLVPTKTIK